MICITDIKTVEVNQDSFEISHFNGLKARELYCFDPLIVKREHICGQRFINTNGKTVCIGMSQKVQDSIGLPFEVFEKQSKKIQSLNDDLEIANKALIVARSENSGYESNIESFKNGGLFHRLKCAFLGRVE